MNKISWKINPTISIGEINFGSPRALVRKTIGKPESVFHKTSSSDNTTDVYSCFHVYFSADDKVEAVEFFDSEINLSIDSRILYPGTLSNARQIFPDLEECYGSFISKSMSIGICAEEDEITSILIGRKDYYRDFLNERS